MTVTLDKKEKLINILHQAKTVSSDIAYPGEEAFRVIEKDIEEDSFMVVTVGEFNNGKSTFLNALLGEDILPTGVTPTTATINALLWGEKQGFQIIKQGVAEKEPVKLEHLEHYMASSEFSFDEVDYLKIQTPSPLLENHLVLIDTPGLNDINRLRSSITYQFIPKADVVFFVLNMTAPVRKTEYTFLSETLLKQGLDRIIFIANFVDRMDEEEIEEVLLEIQKRIESGTGMKEVEIFPLSAFEALEGKMNQDDDLVQLSGILPIESRMEQLCHSGSRSEEKYKRYKTRAIHSLSQLQQFIEQRLDMNGKEVEALRKDFEQIEQWKDQHGQREQVLERYIQERKLEILFMVTKSIGHLFDQIHDEVEERIEFYNGPDINGFLTSQLPLSIKKMMKQWIEVYSDKIHILLGKLEIEISSGLSKSFQEQVKIHSYRDYRISEEQEIEFHNQETMDPLVTSGLLVGGVSTLAMILGGPILIPIIGMAGLPFIQKKMLKIQLDTIKPEIKSEARKQLFYVKDSFTASVESYIERSIHEIKEETLKQFSVQTTRMMHSLESEIRNKQKDRDIQLEQEKILLDSKAIVNGLVKELQ
ncbi:dynamin family protein [Peribacillus acanthi]|uniref:dynamin family protein n=1 Tax=Peribacillus acanthi TaxID=2171554 RepID=UPI000D3E8744|nr:dynamin family protein [Peribacillus acanthi]